MVCSHTARVALSEADAPEKAFREDFGPFVLTERLAVGGSAEVFVARPKRGELPAKQLVIKRPRQKRADFLDYDSMAREAALHDLIQHENVVKVFGAGMVRDMPYIAMEYVAGVDLHRLLRRARSEQRPIPTHVAVYITHCIAQALDRVHNATDKQGVPLHLVHGDVTPSNVYLSEKGEVKLGDFGIAHATQSTESEGSTSTSGERQLVPGKFGYLAPEQISGDPHDHRADLFTLAILLGELVSGGPVFEGTGKLALLLSVRDVNIAPLRAIRHYLPTGLFEVLEKGLRKSPSERFPSALGFAQALAPFASGTAQECRATLQELVAWAADNKAVAAQLEYASQLSRARLTPASGLRELGAEVRSSRPSAVRRSDRLVYDGLPYSTLLELIAARKLHRDDEVSLQGGPFARLSDIAELAGHLCPTSGTTTSEMYEPGPPDYVIDLEDVSPLDVFARLRRDTETGALFVSRVDKDGTCQRLDIYLQSGRVHHVESTATTALLGQYLVRKGALTADQLEHASSMREHFGGQLGDTLVALGIMDEETVLRTLRNQGRDRLALFCRWETGNAQFYRGGAPGPIQSPFDMDLTVVMMAGIIAKARGVPVLPGDSATGGWRLVLGPHEIDLATQGTLDGAPESLQLVPALARRQLALEDALSELLAHVPTRRAGRIDRREAKAALLTARALGWVDFRN